jgi:hypothetical protein
MTYEEFLEFIPSKCMYETIYDDSDGHPILVIRLLDAYGMANKLESAEREACAKVCENLDAWNMDDPASTAADAIRARGQA